MESAQHFIIHVYSVAEAPGNRSAPLEKQRVKVKLRADCYGQKQDMDLTFPKTEWERIEKQGWFLY